MVPVLGPRVWMMAHGHSTPLYQGLLWECTVTSQCWPVHRDLHALRVSEGKGSWRSHPAAIGSLPLLPAAWPENLQGLSGSVQSVGRSYGHSPVAGIVSVGWTEGPGALYSEVWGLCVPHLIRRACSRSQVGPLT